MPTLSPHAEKVARHGHHLSREYIVDPLELARVGEVMDAAPVTVREDVTVGELSNRIASGDAAANRHQALPIVDGGGRLVGIVTRVSRDDRRVLVGYLGRAHVMSARLRWYRSEHTKEVGGGRGGPGARRTQRSRAPVAGRAHGNRKAPPGAGA